jgi:hypothetical protein
MKIVSFPSLNKTLKSAITADSHFAETSHGYKYYIDQLGTTISHRYLSVLTLAIDGYSI